MKRGGNKKFVVPRRAKSTAKEDDAMMNIASFFAGKGRRLSRRDDCDAHFAFKNVAKSTQRCVFDDDDVLFIPLPLKTSFFPLCCEHKGEKLMRERTLLNAKKNLHAKA